MYVLTEKVLTDNILCGCSILGILDTSVNKTMRAVFVGFKENRY